MNIELPKDAKGREIPLDTYNLYDKHSRCREVSYYTYYPDKDRWDVVFTDSCIRFSPHNLSLTPPDSWEKLLDDLDNASKGGDNAECCYMRRECLDTMIQCEGCKLANNTDKECSYLAYGNIAARIRNLRSESE